MEKLLVLDDDEASRRLIRLELCEAYEVIDSGEPRRGLALALEHRPDAILLDLRKPDSSGYELLQTFTAYSQTQKIPVIIVSAEGGAQTKPHCKQLGAYEFFEKPIDFEALRGCLKQATRGPRMIPRTEVRVRLRVPLILRYADLQGKRHEQQAQSENVSLSGFLCTCTVELAAGTMVEVFLTTPSVLYVGKAKAVHADAKNAPVRHYGFRFVEKTGPWVLS